ncbi:MAG: hypothetical protein RL317_875, partial [Pseudomonadota bacterium]
RHEIVHNRFVVDSLKAKGAVFVEELDEVPDGVPVVFSAHGVPKIIPATADARGLDWLDATCPLVSKVHRQAERLVEQGKHIIFIGHDGHPEVIGTFGQVPEGAMTLIETVEDVAALPDYDGATLGFLTQTTLSVDDTTAVVEALKTRFPDIQGPRGEDICYATSNRQESVKAVCARAEKLIVIGAPNSSNSLRLAEVGERLGVPAQLVQRGKDIDFEWLGTPSILGLTAGASAPEVLVREVVEALRDRFDLHEEQVTTAEENMVFKLPRKLTA